MAVEFVSEFCQADTVDLALAQVQAAHAMGATHAKWQVLQPDRLAGREATRYWHESLGGNDSQHDMFADFGCLNTEEWRRVARACKASGVEFMATPFDLEAVELLESVGVTSFKVASGDLTYRPLLERIAATKKRVYLSTGAGNQYEIVRAFSWLRGCEVIPMACDLVYPCHAEDASLAQQLRALQIFRNGWGEVATLGYSDHTTEVVTGAVAVSLGATVLEKHITLDKSRDRPDDRMALTVDQAKEYKRLADQAHALIAKPEGDPQAPAREGARRSAHAAHDLDAGHVLTESDVAWLRPCPPNSISPAKSIAGRTLISPVKAGERITQDAVA